MVLNKLVNNKKDMMCDAALLDILGIVHKAMATKPNDSVKRMSECIMEITYYINDLRMERSVYEHTLSEANRKRLEAENEVTQLIQITNETKHIKHTT
jgi:hypothetical protein